MDDVLSEWHPAFHGPAHFSFFYTFCSLYIFYHFSSCFICQSPSFKKWITSMPMPLFVSRLLKNNNNKIVLTCIHISQGVLCKVLYREGPSPFPFVDHIVSIGITFIYLYLKKKRYPFCLSSLFFFKKVHVIHRSPISLPFGRYLIL